MRNNNQETAPDERAGGLWDEHGSVTVLGAHVHSVTVSGLLRQALTWARQDKPRTIGYANIHVLNTAYKDDGLRRILNEFDLIYCDGEGVRLGARLLGANLPERMTGADWLIPLCVLCDAEQVPVFFLGSKEGIASKAAEKIRESCPDLRVDAHHGYLGDPAVSSQAINRVNLFKPGILLVGMGTPIQERWIKANRDKLDVPVVWAVGALFDFIAGTQPRAPQWMVANGLEWAHRLLWDPARLWKRYVVGNPLFLARVLMSKWKTGGRIDP